MLVLVGIICIVLIANQYLEIIRISGDSMLPTLHDGDLVLIDKLTSNEKYRLGEIVVYPSPYDIQVLVVKRIKRLKKIPVESGTYNLAWLEGDNAKVSLDSRTYGWLETANMEGRVIKIWTRKKKNQWKNTSTNLN